MFQIHLEFQKTLESQQCLLLGYGAIGQTLTQDDHWTYFRKILSKFGI